MLIAIMIVGMVFAAEVAVCAPVVRSTVSEPLRGCGYAPRSYSYAFMCLDNDSMGAEHNADTLFIPASVAKTVTAAASFDLLGPEYVFRTPVYVSGGFDPDSGVIRGDIFVHGVGDPGFLAERTWLLVQQLVNRGVREVRGACIVSDSYFDSVTIGPGFGGESTSRAYEAPVGALSINFNTVEVYTWPGSRPGSPIGVRVFPPQMGLQVVSRARTVGPGEGGRGVNVRTELRGGATIVAVDGEMSVGAEPRCVYRKVWETTGNTVRVLSALLSECGIRVTGGVRCGKVPDSIRTTAPFFVFESLPLPAYVAYLFKYSNNVAAEMLFRTMAAERCGVGSWDSAVTVVSRWWRERGLPGELQLCNGSGMGDCSRMSAGQTVALLSYVYRQKVYYPDFIAAMSTAGFDGTLKDRFVRSRLRGLVRAKTGTLNNRGVSSLAGYAFCGGRTYAFAVFVNDTTHGQYEHWQLQERILETVLP